MSFLTLMAAATSVALTAPGPNGALAGTMLDAGRGAPVVLIVPGSGPTDRDGNNPLGITASSYRLLAEGLAARGVSSVRVDKRGMFGSKAAIADGNKVTIGDYAADVHRWSDVIRKRTGAPCIWVLGHSEGGLVALAAAQQPAGICGVALVAAPGRKLGDVLRSQLRANPANAPLLGDALKVVSSLEAGRPIDVSGMNPALQSLFAPGVQGFLIDAMAKDPARLAASLRIPTLIVAGGRDMQVPPSDGQALASAQPGARLVVIPAMTHVLKDAASGSAADNMKTYADPSLPVSAPLVEAIAAFVRSPAPRR